MVGLSVKYLLLVASLLFTGCAVQGKTETGVLYCVGVCTLSESKKEKAGESVDLGSDT